MAGAPPCLADQICDEADGRCQTMCERTGDADGDGDPAVECGGSDCDDADPRRASTLAEVCDPDDRDEDCDPSTYGRVDRDRDGFDDASCCNGASCGDDCNDRIGSVHPTSIEVCNGVDDDCDGEVDEGVLVAGFADEDGDLHGDPTRPRDGCPDSPRFSVVGDDCDDTNRRVHGAQLEICDELDNDCDEVVDEDAVALTWYRDADGDGFGDPRGGTTVSCVPPEGFDLLPTDCDDSAAGVSPVADEACNGRDDDCNGRADFRVGPSDFEDDDGDGAVDRRCGAFGDDPDDGDPDSAPGAPELCDGLDNDGDGAVDEDPQTVSWWTDGDGDGYGAGTAMESCAPLPGRVTRDGDCDDSDATRRPGAFDACDGRDEDCDGDVDENAQVTAWYTDEDGDGAGVGDPVLACARPEGTGPLPNDCAPADPARYEGQPERCNGVDDDCDDALDEGGDALCSTGGATGACTDGECVLFDCAAPFFDCDGDARNLCEIDGRSDTRHCGGCDVACPDDPHGSAACVESVCAITCEAPYADCDGDPFSGCEAMLLDDPRHCGACGTRCAPRPHAAPDCEDGACAFTCDAGFADCNGDLEDGCESEVDFDPANCGGCGSACPVMGDVCIRGDCFAPAFASDGSEGDFLPTASLTLAPGVHHFGRVVIPAGVIVRTGPPGVVEIRATGEVIIDGVIDVSGGDGSDGLSDTDDGRNGAGGHTGTSVDGAPASPAMCSPAGGSGIGGPGEDAGLCGAGGVHGGGAGGEQFRGGGGGGGFAGGGGGGGSSSAGGAGGGVSGTSTGGAAGGTSAPGEGGETSAGAPYAGERGADIAGGSGGGGGSIGADAAADLAVASTFRPGSGGGGGAAGAASPAAAAAAAAAPSS